MDINFSSSVCMGEKNSEDLAVISRIEYLDLEPIKYKLMKEEDWSLERCDLVEVSYKQFLFLVHKYRGKKIVPTSDIDTFWHYHILDTYKYAEDCQRAFGRFLHHFPYFGIRGDDDKRNFDSAVTETQLLVEKYFYSSLLKGGDSRVCWGGNPEQCWGPWKAVCIDDSNEYMRPVPQRNVSPALH